MPLTSTRGSASSAGYGQNLISNKQNIFVPGGTQVYQPEYYVYDSMVSPDGTAYFLLTLTFVSFPGSYYWNIQCYSRNVTTGDLTYVSTYPINSLIVPNTTTAYLDISSDSKNLYVSITGAAESTTSGTNVVAQYSINATTKQLTPLSPEFIDLGIGAGASYIALPPDGRVAYVGSRSFNKIYLLSRNTSTGILTYSSTYTTPAGTLPYMLYTSSDNANLYASSWGSDTTKAVLQYSRNTLTGNLTALSPEGLSGGAQMQYLNFNPNETGIHCGSAPSGFIWIYIRNPATGVLSLLANQGGSAYRATYSADGNILFGMNSNNFAAGLTSTTLTYSPVQFNVNPTTGELTERLYPKMIAFWGSGVVIPSPNYDYYYAPLNTQNNIIKFKNEGGYLIPQNYPAPMGSALSLGAQTTRQNYPSYCAVSPDGKSLYTNGYWPYGGGSNYTPYGAQFDIDPVTKIPSRSTFTPTSTIQGNGGIVISSDSSFVYIVDDINPPVIRQYSRNLVTGDLTPLSTPTVSLPAPFPFSASQPKNLWSVPVLTPDGKNLYVHYSATWSGYSYIPFIVQYSRNTTTGLLTLVGTTSVGNTAFYVSTSYDQTFSSSIIMHPSGNFLYAVGSFSGVRTLTGFSINPSTGNLTQLNSITPVSDLCFGAITPDGNYIYLPLSTGDMLIIRVNSSTGNLTLINIKDLNYATNINGTWGGPVTVLPGGTKLVAQVVTSRSSSGRPIITLGVFNIQSSGNIVLQQSGKSFNEPIGGFSDSYVSLISAGPDGRTIYYPEQHLTYGTVNI